MSIFNKDKLIIKLQKENLTLDELGRVVIIDQALLSNINGAASVDTLDSNDYLYNSDCPHTNVGCINTCPDAWCINVKCHPPQNK
jgi:hypothetical protein